jgi:hypothetical protein
MTGRASLLSKGDALKSQDTILSLLLQDYVRHAKLCLRQYAMIMHEYPPPTLSQ